MKRIIMVTLILIACSQAEDKPLMSGTPYDMTCSTVLRYGLNAISRCINSEVICYQNLTSNGVAISCIKNEVKPNGEME